MRHGVLFQHKGWVVGFKFQIGGMWIGYHWSDYNRRVCINILPCCTVWIMTPGGRRP